MAELMTPVSEDIQIGKRLFRAITNNAPKAISAIGLVYVSSAEPGFTRVRAGDRFDYMDGNRKLRYQEHLMRIRKLVLPPAWENVWICKLHNGHLQATGIDKRGRKQYRYHPLWLSIRNQTKFFRLLEFGQSLPAIRKRIEKDLSQPGYPQDKVLAAMVSLLEKINIRVGNAFYEKLYGSFGLTTLKNHHVKINGSSLQIMFKGKKGVVQNISLSSRRLARIIQGCKEIPGKELFQYYDEKGVRRIVDSGMVNDYIREISGKDFTAKDFRTWAGTLQAITAFREVGGFETKYDMTRKVTAALDLVARHLGNTRTVCRKYYVHPVIIELYQEGKLARYIDLPTQMDNGKNEDGYSPDEVILLKVLNNALI
jgi:DNA topoisomerase I